MNQCVPSWDVEDNHHPPLPHHRLDLRTHSNSNSLALHVPTLDYEVAELTWENGQIAIHGLGPPRLAASSLSKYTWEKQPQPAGGTLESIVNQAVIPHGKSGGDEFVPWFEDQRREVTAPPTLNMDALVPCSINRMKKNEPEPSAHVPGISTCVVGCSTTPVGSCSGASEGDAQLPRANMVVAAASQDWSSRADQSLQSVSGSATCGRDSRQVTLDTYDRGFGTAEYTSTSLGTPGNTSSAEECTKTVDDHDSPCQGKTESRARNDQEGKKKRNGKSSISTKRSRAAAIHNQSERKRRDKINQRMKTLQKLVPNSSKTDKASVLDEAIEYLKQLQTQVNLMSRMNMSQMMFPLALQQQLLQMSMMAPMGIGMNMGTMGMGMGMNVMDLNSISRPNITGIPPVLHPAAAYMMPTTSAWGGLGDRLAGAAPSAAAIPDPLASFLACQSQPMSLDAYSRMAALYQQFQQAPDTASKK